MRSNYTQLGTGLKRRIMKHMKGALGFGCLDASWGIQCSGCCATTIIYCLRIMPLIADSRFTYVAQ